MTLEEIMECVVLPKVTITGGEPLMHGDLFKSLLLKLLRSNYYKVTVETNGSFIPYFTGLREDENLRYVLDYKLPSSGMMAKMNTDAFDILRPVDVIKFVISDLKDYDTAKALLRKGAVQSNWSAHKVFSPGIVDQKDFSGWPAKLAELLIADALWDDCLKNVQYSLQIHKVLWPNAVRER
jgi:7-carboxy-7-deazaguanine synthase